MRKSSVIDIAKMLSKECFKMYLKNEKKDIGIRDEESIIEGFREENDTYRMIFYINKLEEVRCEIIYDKKTKLLHSYMFKQINN